MSRHCCVCGATDGTKAGLSGRGFFVCGGSCYETYHQRMGAIRDEVFHGVCPSPMEILDDATRRWFEKRREEGHPTERPQGSNPEWERTAALKAAFRRGVVVALTKAAETVLKHHRGARGPDSPAGRTRSPEAERADIEWGVIHQGILDAVRAIDPRDVEDK